MLSDEKMLLIRRYDLWRHISDEEYEALNVVHNFIEAKKGDYIYFEAFHHNKLYFLKEGHVRIGYINDKGEEVIKEIIEKGEIFGQITLERNNLQGEFAQAYRHDVSLCAFTIESFEQLLAKKPQLALKYSKQVGAKLRVIENRLVNLLNKDVKTRLLHFFWLLIQQHPEEMAAGQVRIPNFLTHEDIAQLIGASRQTITTLINELALEGIIGFNRQEIRIPDVKKLQILVNVG
ncbi:Crp/Fnr family transcriptional regulator [Paraflavitalea sp. CAU 1676]|uniref:Crp/Fnr family transcriptional regulator n=1 Tax=Paraflavitalea sp. CAU 1676 TaxID=3032598 RepID=UPI0023D99E45|nr:Crp/Fnr family transcriptional regulator [Paraflavitalea sp. CAU 1676]MDF2192047.1 Crp/Fnr family transcriptional regulator [Paraflavitalea sp. CAU 1676]